MYIINVEPISEIMPRMFEVEFSLRSGGLGFTIIVPAISPQPALEKAFRIFPELRGTCRQAQVHEVAYVGIDLETGRAFVVKRKRGLLNLRGLREACPEPQSGGPEGGQRG